MSNKNSKHNDKPSKTAPRRTSPPSDQDASHPKQSGHGKPKTPKEDDQEKELADDGSLRSMPGGEMAGDVDNNEFEEDLAMILKIVNENLKISELATHHHYHHQDRADISNLTNDPMATYKRNLLMKSDFQKMF